MRKKSNILLASLLVAAGIGLIVGAWQLSTQNGSVSSLPVDVEELIPGENANVLQGATVGIELDGTQQYNIMLWLNGLPIFICPDGQLEDCGAQKTDFRLTYIPQEGEVEIGENCLRAEYSLATRPDDTKTVRWCYDAYA